MKHLKTLILALLAVFGLEQVRADVTASEGDVLWQESFTGGSSSTTFSETTSWSTGTGTTMLNNSDKSSISYSTSDAMLSTATAGGIDGSHCWLKKQTTGYFQVDDIPVYNATKVQFSLAKNSKVQLTITYKRSSDTSWQSGGTISASNTSGSSSEITVTPNSTISIKIQRASNNDASRIDDLTLTVVNISSGGGSTEPTLSLTPSSWDFEEVATTGTASKTFKLSGSNLTAGNLTISVPNGYSVDPSSLSVSTGTLAETDFTVSKNTSTAGTYEGNFTIYGGGVVEASAASASLSMTVVAPIDPTISFDEATIEVNEAIDLRTLFESNSEGAVSYEITEGGSYASLGEDGYTLTGSAIGTVTVRASQAANAGYNAKVVSATIEVIAAQPKSILNFTVACGGTGTANDGVEWTVASDAAESNFDSNRGIHYGTGKAAVSYLELTSEAFTNNVKKIEVEAAGANTPSLSITVGGDAFGETATDITNSNVKYTFQPTTEQSATDFTGVIVVRLEKASSETGALYIKSIVVTYEAAAPAAVEDPTIEGEQNFLNTTTVTLSCETTGASIYYTTNGDEPTSESTLYSAPFSLNATATVKAIAILGSDESSVAEMSFTQLTTYTTIPAMFEAAGDAEAWVGVTFGNWVVSGVSTNGKNVYVTDNTNGFIIFNNDGGLGDHFAVGNVLSGTAKCKMLKFNGALELKELNSETAGLNIATGGTISENQTALASLSGVNTGSLISISGACTNPSGSIFKVGDFQLYKALYAFENPTAGSNYNVTGIYVQYGETKEICPRSAEDIAEQQEKQNANTQWVATSKTVRMGDATTDWWSTSSDGAKTFSSTNTEVATINAVGEISLVAPGSTTLKFSTAASDDYYAGPEVSMVLTVKAALPANSKEFTWDATAQGYSDQQVLTTVTNAPKPVIEFVKAGSTDNKWFNNGSAVRFYKTNYFTVTAPDDSLLIEININFASGYTQTLTTDVITYSLTGIVGTWSGLAKSVKFTNSGNDVARITSINVIYAKGTETELEIADVAMKISETHTIVPTKHNPNSAPIEYTIATEDQAYATIENGVITPHALTTDPITVTARIAQGSNYTAAETTFTITVAEKPVPAMSFSPSSCNANLGSEFTEPTLTKPDGVSVAYSSSVGTVATVDAGTGEITLVGEGTTIITATSEVNDDYVVGTATYTLNVIDPNKDVLTATAIGKTSYENWSKSFTTTTVYAGNSTANNGDIQLRKSSSTQDKSGIITTSVAGYLNYLYASAGTNTNSTDHYLNVYAKNTKYESVADLYDANKRGTLIGTIAEEGGEIDFADGKGYSDNYKYFGLISNSGAVYFDSIIVKWTPATFNEYTVTYEAGDAEGEDVVINNVEEGTPITLAAADTYSKEGYTFMGWNDGTQTYAAGATYPVNDNVTFTAQWAQNFTVTYKAGDAGETQVVRTVPAGAYNLESCSFVYANHAFDGWQNGANKYNAGAPFEITGDVEFVAQWVDALDPITVTFTVNVEKSSTKTLYKDGINLSVTGGDLNRTDNYRCYASNSMNIATELGNIITIDITSEEGNTAQAFSIEGDNGNYAYESLIGTWTGSSAAIQLNASSQVRMTKIEVTYIPNAYLRTVSAGEIGTLCLPFNGEIEGAELLEFVDKDADNVYLGDADASVQAGKPYLFLATADQIKVTFNTNAFVAMTNHNGLYGTYVNMAGDDLMDLYIIGASNLYYYVNSNNCSLKAYRAYFKLNEVPVAGAAPARRRFAIGNGSSQIVTGFDQIKATEAPVKMIIDGRLYIIRGEKMYDTTGRLVK